MILIIGVRFRKSGKVYYFDPTNLDIKKGDHVIVETARGIEYGTVVLEPRNVTDDKVVQPLKPVIRLATEEDAAINEDNEQKEKEAFDICLEKIKKHNLDMKLIDSEYTFDKNKLLFYFTADGRIDFRELVKDLAAIFRTRIELRQIGVRDETKLIGGIAICGRPLCCHTYLADFAPVSIKMAKEQNLSLNPAKISGVCGRLMCCLKNEEEAYEYLNSTLPHINDTVQTVDGYTGTVQSVSVLKQLVRVLIVKEDSDEKEVREYPVKELTFEKKHRTSVNPVGTPLPDEELDESALKELEKMEQNDIEDLTDTENEKEQKTPRQKKYQGKKPYNKSYKDKSSAHRDNNNKDSKSHNSKDNRYNNHEYKGRHKNSYHNDNKHNARRNDNRQNRDNNA